MPNEIEERLSTIRNDLDRKNTNCLKTDVDAFLVPRADEYLGEYVPAQNERLLWISNFTGSAGAVIVLRDTSLWGKALIFVDGRYTIQVRQQVPDSLFEYHHLHDDPPIEWLCKNLGEGTSVGMDTRLHSYAFYLKAKIALAKSGITLKEMINNPIDSHWANRPSPEPLPAMLLEEQYTGEHSEKKRIRIGKLIEEAGADLALISQLDSIAWLLNIRGQDISRLPVILGFGILQKNGDFSFFTDPRKIPNDLHLHVGDGVTIKDEGLLGDALAGIAATGSTIMLDDNTCNAWAQIRCDEIEGSDIIYQNDPVILPKAQKNSIELSGVRNCHVRDGSALSRFLAWIESEVARGNLHDEGGLADKLESFRRELHDIHDLSFDTISAAGSNGAMCHYSHLNGTPAQLEMNSLYLVDSGGQFSDGTTDVTRTVSIGIPTEEHRRMFTLVLKGHIALNNAVFPVGTTGVQLDVLARQFLWQEGLDYDHGTGHGVGAFLSVHEGPQRIAKQPSPLGELLPGMVLSNEPGYYKENCYGIRCENLMIINERDDGMMTFETVTFAPFDRRLVDKDLMSTQDLAWLNAYHKKVNEKLSPLLEDEDLSWLKAATATI
jgi:Xaa-Pro aminopeptidase